jgi:hypothetical protein
MITIEQQQFIDYVYNHFKEANDNCVPQGWCGQIAEAIQKHLGGELVAGYLSFRGFRRMHWWLELNGHIIDPMSDDYMPTDPHEHEEVHRDIKHKYW